MPPDIPAAKLRPVTPRTATAPRSCIRRDRKSTRLNSSHSQISYAVFCLKKKKAELPRDFEGAALLASSELPRRVRIKATKYSLKLSTAYRADQLARDIVRTARRRAVNYI